MVDNTDAGVTVTGKWGSSRANRARIGDDYLQDFNADKGKKSVAYGPKLPRTARTACTCSGTAAITAVRVPVDVYVRRRQRTVYV